MNQAVNHKHYVIYSYWYKSNKVGFIQEIHILPSYSQKMVHKPIFGHTFFGHNSAIFRPTGLKIFIGTHETIIYWGMGEGATLKNIKKFLPRFFQSIF